MVEKSIIINLALLKDYYWVFDVGHSIALKESKDVHKYEFTLTFDLDEREFNRIERLFKELVTEAGLKEYYHELLSFYVALKDLSEDSEITNSSNFNSYQALEHLIKLFEFKEVAEEMNISIDLKDTTKNVKFIIPNIDGINISIYRMVMEQVAKELQTASFNLRLWLRSLPEISKESLIILRDSLPTIYDTPPPNYKIAYASYPLIRFLNKHGLQNNKGDNYKASSPQALFIQNFFHLFGILPGAIPIHKRSIILKSDLNFSQTLNNQLASFKKTHTK